MRLAAWTRDAWPLCMPPFVGMKPRMRSSSARRGPICFVQEEQYEAVSIRTFRLRKRDSELRMTSSRAFCGAFAG